MSDQLVALADDLSGAAEAAVLLAGVHPDGRVARSASVVLGGTPSSVGNVPSSLRKPPAGDDEVVVMDLDTRDRPGTTAAGDLGSVGFCKVDSLFRGDPGALVDRLIEHGRTPIVTTAVPALGRTLIHGRILVHGAPLTDSGLLTLEPTMTGDVLGQLGRERTKTVPLETVRGPRQALIAALDLRSSSDSDDEQRVVLVDAENDHDLDAVVSAAQALPTPVLVGAGGLAAAVGRRATAGTPLPHDAPSAHQPGPSLVVVGTASASATAQLRVLADAGVPVLPIPRAVLLDALVDHEVRDIDHPALLAVRAARNAGTVAITLEDREVPTPHLSRRLAAGLGVVASTLAGSCNLVLTGGETARRTLDHLGVDRLRLERVLDHGCVLGVTATGRGVVTRPGSFGAPDNLLLAVRALGDAVPGAAAPNPRKAALA